MRIGTAWLPRMDEQRFALNASLLDAAFPFHIVIDRDLRITQAGSSIQRMHQDNMVGSPIQRAVRRRNAEDRNHLRRVRQSAQIAVLVPFVDQARSAASRPSAP